MCAGSDREALSDVVNRIRPPRPRGSPDHLARHGDRRPDVQPEDEVEVAAGQVEEGRLAVGADVVHEHVDRPEPGPRFGDEPFRFAVARQVGGDVMRVRHRQDRLGVRNGIARPFGRQHDSAPAAANARATASPIPWLLPVTSAVLPVNIARSSGGKAASGSEPLAALPPESNVPSIVCIATVPEVSPMSAVARVLFAPPTEEDRFLPEGPTSVTVAGRPALAWVNIQTGVDATRGAIHLRFWDTGEHRVLPQPARPGFLAPTDRPGVVLVGREKELGTLDLHTGSWTRLATHPRR